MRTCRLRTEKLIKPGPTNLVTRTTAISLHGENETRMLSVPSNDSKAQTRAVMISSSAEKKRQEADLGDGHDFQRWLASRDIRDAVIPYARCVAAQIPPEAVRLRRDWNTVRSLIKAHAIMHQENRETGHGQIIAIISDYQAVRSLVNDLIADAIGATVPRSVRQTVEIVSALETRPLGHATVHDVCARLKLERSAATRRLHTARDHGYLVNLEDKKGKPARYVTGDPLPGEVVVLPDVHTICTGDCTHLDPGETAGQDCDCTGVCRCAGTAEPREEEKP